VQNVSQGRGALALRRFALGPRNGRCGDSPSELGQALARARPSFFAAPGLAAATDPVGDPGWIGGPVGNLLDRGGAGGNLNFPARSLWYA
jgi:hypothetical protein